MCHEQCSRLVGGPHEGRIAVNIITGSVTDTTNDTVESLAGKRDNCYSLSLVLPTTGS